MSTYKSIEDAIKEIEYWLRLATLLHEPMKESLLNILHNHYNRTDYVGLPSDPTLLNAELRKNINKIKQLQSKKILKKDQVEVLLPTGSNQTDSSTFDVTLIILLIISFTTLPPPINGWNKFPSPTDTSIAAFVLRARAWRNEFMHDDPKSITLSDFNKRWTEGVNIIRGLKLVTYDTNRLKIANLNARNRTVLRCLKFFSKKILQKVTALDTELAHDIQLTAHDTQFAAQDAKLKALGASFNAHDSKLTAHDTKLKTLGKSFDVHDTKLTALGTNFDAHDTKLTSHDTKLDANDTKLKTLGKSFDAHDTKLTAHDSKLSALGTSFEDHDSKLAAHDTEMEVMAKTLAEQVARLEKELNFIRSGSVQSNGSQRYESRGCCLDDVIQYISSEIGPQKPQLLSRLEIDQSEEETPLSEILKDIPWHHISLHLERLGRSDIVDHLTKNTLLTEDIEHASSLLRSQYDVEVIRSLANHSPLVNHDVIQDNNNNLYTELAVLRDNEIDQDLDNNSDRSSLLEQRHLEKDSIELEHLVQQNDDVVFVRGVGGMGKTAMLEMFALRWVRNQLNPDTPLDFVFLFSCREINLLQGRFVSIEDLFKEKYPKVFDRISLKDLAPIADRILIIVDGVDELQGVYESQNNSSMSPFQTIFSLINTHGTVLKGHKSIACGRPKACDYIRRFLQTEIGLQNRTNIKTVEVCGFNDAQIDKYIEKFFAGNKEKADRVREAIRISDNLRIMASTPVLIWVIAIVYSEDLITKPLNTYTELYMYACLVFLRNHMHGTRANYHKPLIELLDDEEIYECVYALMVLSVKTYMNDQVLFTEDDIVTLKCPVHLEQTGLIVKYSRGEITEPVYQFKHLVLQEFLTGLYLCITKGISPYLTNRELSSCSPVIFGIQRMLRDNENKLFSKFFNKLTELNKRKMNFSEKLMEPFNSLSFHLYASINAIEIPKCMIGTNVLIIDTSFPECQEFMTNLNEAKQKIECPFSFVLVRGRLSRVDLRNALFVMDFLRLTPIIPNCMINNNSIVIDTAFTECVGFLQLLPNTKLKCPFSTLEVICQLRVEERDNVLALMKHYNLKLKLPDHVVQKDTLHIDTDDQVCTSSLKSLDYLDEGIEFSAMNVTKVYFEKFSEAFEDKVMRLFKLLQVGFVEVPQMMHNGHSVMIDFSNECLSFIHLFNNFSKKFNLKLHPPSIEWVDLKVSIGQNVDSEICYDVGWFISKNEFQLNAPQEMIRGYLLKADQPSSLHQTFLRVSNCFGVDNVSPVGVTHLALPACTHVGFDIENSVILLRKMHLKLQTPANFVEGSCLLIDGKSQSCMIYIRIMNALLEDASTDLTEVLPYTATHAEIRNCFNQSESSKEIMRFIKHLDLRIQIPDSMIEGDTLLLDFGMEFTADAVTLASKEKMDINSVSLEYVKIIGKCSKDLLDAAVHLARLLQLKVVPPKNALDTKGRLMVCDRLFDECHNFMYAVPLLGQKLDKDFDYVFPDQFSLRIELDTTIHSFVEYVNEQKKCDFFVHDDVNLAKNAKQK
ncbi:uncharacterized protein [Clytia hemisphaerica]|uniref:uncharacterized protein n=1 Tax=Clytia hemisphaerica TaxID=252671 RepID=UPI0034D4FDD0